MHNRTHDVGSDITIDLLGLNDVRRWNVIRTLRDQSVAEHAFNVAVIATDLMMRLPIDWAHGSHLHCEVLWWALIHDVPETLTGDIDGKFKRDHAEVKAAVAEAENWEFPWFAMSSDTTDRRVKAIVKLADRIEALRFIKDWGHGVRADDVYHENEKSLYQEVVPWAVGEMIMGGTTITHDEMETAVKFTLNYSTSESNSIQLRQHRAITGMSEPSGV